ncbi:MAG: glycosyltransferase WbuB, partial [Bacteroidetes bacterium]
MHLLYLQQLLILPEAPGNSRSWELARAFVQAGHRVTLITSSAGLKENASFEREGIRVEVLPVAYQHKMSFIRRALAFVGFWLRAWLAGRAIRGVDAVLAYTAP